MIFIKPRPDFASTLLWITMLVIFALPVMAQSATSSDAPVKTEQLEDDKTIDDFLGKVSIENGHRISRPCMVCHTFDEGGPNRAGSNLFGIIGARIAHIEGFNYSDTLKAHHGRIWTVKNLNAWLQNPNDFIPGTRMNFGGVSDDRDRKDLIAYIRSMK